MVCVMLGRIADLVQSSPFPVLHNSEHSANLILKPELVPFGLVLWSVEVALEEWS